MRVFLFYLPVSVLVLALQTVFGIIFRDLAYIPDLMLIFCVYNAHYNNRFAGQLIGAYSGLCEDLVSSAPFGTHVLIRTVISFIFGHTSRWRMQSNSIAPVILVILALFVKYILYFILGVFFAITNMISFLFSVAVLYEIAYTIIATPILFSLLSLIPNRRAVNEI